MSIASLLKKLPLLVLAMTLLLAFFMPLPATAFNPLGDSCAGQGSDSPVCQDNSSQNGSTDKPVTDTINTVANLVAMLAGIVGVILIVLGGYSIITSGGSQDKVAVGRRRIIGALIGLVVVALAWTITTFVAENFIN